MKKIAITMGDAAGVGPEIIAKALYCTETRDFCAPLVIGSKVVMQEAIDLLNLPLKLRLIESPDECTSVIDTIEFINVETSEGFEKSKATVKNGKACVSYIKKAVELALNKKVDGIATAPISKEALKMAGMKWHGHTEMLAELTDTKDYAMMLAGEPLRVILVTIHTPLRSVPDMITRESVLKTIKLAKKACDMLRIENPKIAVAGLNPHAGEAGIFGNEETNEIIPAIEDAKKLGIPVTGPYPPDTVFNKAYNGGIDIVVCMYHDQGLIPLKMIAFDMGVNLTVGLPFIRTSPDHGTAYDIAWKGIANPSSMLEAIKLASRLKL